MNIACTRTKTTTGNLVPVSFCNRRLGARMVIMASDNRSVQEWLYHYLKPYEMKGYAFYPVNDEAEFSEYAGKSDTVIVFVEDIFFGKRTNAKLENYRKQYPKLKIILFSVSLSPSKEISRYLQWRSDSFLTLRESEKEINRELDYIFLKPYEVYEFRKINIIKIDLLPENEPHLTYRENEIIRCIVDCKTIKEIADEFMLSERTVQNHISNIYGKFGIRNMVGVLKLAVSKGIISVDELKA